MFSQCHCSCLFLPSAPILLLFHCPPCPSLSPSSLSLRHQLPFCSDYPFVLNFLHSIMKSSYLSLGPPHDTFLSMFVPVSAIFFEGTALSTYLNHTYSFPSFLHYYSHQFFFSSFTLISFLLYSTSYTLITYVCFQIVHKSSPVQQYVFAGQHHRNKCPSTASSRCQIPSVILMVYLFPAFYIFPTKYHIPLFAIFIKVLKEAICVITPLCHQLCCCHQCALARGKLVLHKKNFMAAFTFRIFSCIIDKYLYIKQVI